MQQFRIPIICTLLLSCLFSVTSLFGQSKQKIYNFVNLKQGISNAPIASIVQDHNGFIWLGTSGAGLYKFDGITYTSYQHKNGDSTSISSSLIHCTYIDNKQRLWVGTENGLNLYDRELDQFQRISFDAIRKGNVASSISVYSLSGDAKGNIFIGTFQNGLFRYNVSSHQLKAIPFASKHDDNIVNINDIKIAANGTVYVATNIGIKAYDATTNTLKKASFHTLGGILTIDDGVESLLIDANNHLWVGTLNDGIFKILPQDIHRSSEEVRLLHFKLTNKRVLAMTQIKDGSLFIGTENDGLQHIDQEGNVINSYVQDKTDKNSIPSNSIWSLYVDSDERIWLGYYNSGVGVYDDMYDKFQGLESLPGNVNSLQVGSVTGIVEVEGKLWISMDGGGIDIYDPAISKFTHINTNSNASFSGLTSDDIQTIFVDSRSNIWAGSWNSGVFLLKSGTTEFLNINKTTHPKAFKSNKILSFAEDAEGTIWIGTFYNGLMSYDPKTENFEHYSNEVFVSAGLFNSAVRKVLVDKDDDIWVGTTQGLFQISKGTNGIKVVSLVEKMSKVSDNVPSANHILALDEDNEGNIWIGTRGAGLCRYNKVKGKLTWFNQLYGLGEESVSGILQSQDGHLWISGNSGITRLNIASNSVVNFTNNDGLLSNDFNFNATYKDQNGNLYFGNYKGLDYFHPNEIVTNQSVPQLHLTGFKLFNQDVFPKRGGSPLNKVITETDSIVLNYKQSVFTIEYAGVNFTRPEKNQYAYFLEGLEDSWNYVGDLRNATYTNLDHGDYIFKLKAANNDGIWNEIPLQLKVKVLPPWWKTNLAIAIYLTSFAVGVFLLNRITQSRIRERQLIRNERIQRAHMVELHEKKLQFFTNISHEFRTPLTLIINPLEDIMHDRSLDLPSSVKDKHSIIHKNTDRLYRLINELMDFRKLEFNKVSIKAQQLSLVKFTKEIAGYFKEEAFNRNIHLSFDADLPEISVWADEQMLEKIIFNILSNAFKVTPDGGAINIDLRSNQNLEVFPLLDKNKSIEAVEIKISDTGPGLKKKQVKQIFERFYQVDNLNKSYYGGTGIGLEVVRSFVQLHKGIVQVDSSYGKGTVFKVLLPAGKDHFADNELLMKYKEPLLNQPTESISPFQEAIDLDALEEEMDTKSRTLLIVEDNTELRNYLCSELKKHYKLLTASHGKEGFAMAKKTLPDIILTDVIMPEMDGFEFCKLIKSDIRTSHIPMLMLTAKSRIEDRIEGVGLGADAYMTKPFDMRLLKLKLSQLITSRQLIFDKYFSAISGSDETNNTTSLDKDFIQKVLTYISENMSDSELSVELLATQLHLSRSQLYRKIKSLTGQTVNEFLRNVRLQKAKQLLESHQSANVSEVCYNVGFSSPSYFTKCFKAHFGVLPTEIEVKKK